MSTVRQRLFVCLIALVIVFGVVVSAAPNIAYAESGELNYDKTSVMDDLSTSTVNGQPFDMKDYPYDEDSQAQIVNFVEYCYSYKGNMQSNYGLYPRTAKVTRSRWRCRMIPRESRTIMRSLTCSF